MTLQTSGLDVAALAYAELVTLFGREFSVEHGESLGTYWRGEISRLTVAELERGLRLLTEQRGRAPNCSEFVNVCRTGHRLTSPDLAGVIGHGRRRREALEQIRARIGASR